VDGPADRSPGDDELPSAVARGEPTVVSASHTANVVFGNALLDGEIDRRNERKREQEGTAQAIVVAAGVLLAGLIAIADNADLFNSGASWVARSFFMTAMAAAVVASGCGLVVQAPRRFVRLGEEALSLFRKSEFLDRPEQEVQGRTLSTKVTIAVAADDQHERKARWLKAAFVSAVLALVGVGGVGIDLAIEGTPRESSTSSPTLPAG
jgi:hypothetical protein